MQRDGISDHVRTIALSPIVPVQLFPGFWGADQSHRWIFILSTFCQQIVW